jgi:uncharacterized protein YyaL (SSP411 family)
MQEWVVIGGTDAEEFADVVSALREAFVTNRVLAARDANVTASNSAALDAVFANRTAVKGRTTLYICENFACQAPLVGWEAISAKLAELTSPTRPA